MKKTIKATTKRVPVPMGVHSHTSRNNPSGQQIALGNNDGADYRPSGPTTPSNTNNIPDSAYQAGAGDDY